MNKFQSRLSETQKKSIPLSSALFTGALVAVVAFSAGMQAQDNGLLSTGLFGSKSVSQNGQLPENLDFSSVEEVYDTLRANFDGVLTEQELLDGMKSGLVQASGDEYTVFLNKEQAEQFDSDLNGKFSGIGAELGKENGQLIIIAPLDGYPAQKAGVRSKDVLVAINDEDTTGMSVEDAVLKIRGESGTSVKITVLRGEERLSFDITREQIVVPSVEHEVLDGNIGYLRISRFAEDTSKLAREAAEEFKAKNVNGVVLDLRDNSGGFLSSAVDVSGLWVENKVIVDQRENNGETVTETLKSGGNAPLKGIKTALLINGGSASASEIVAGALQDYDAATLIGETSFGKGSVQTLEPISNGGIVKITVARWFTPNGNNIDKEGITPDIEEKLDEKALKKEIDNQKNRALDFIKNGQ